MATSFTTVFPGVNVREFDIIATADGDTTVVIPHGLQQTPFLSLTPLLQAPAGFSQWAATAIDDTDVTLTKSTAAGSGNAGAQVRLTCMAPEARQLG